MLRTNKALMLLREMVSLNPIPPAMTMTSPHQIPAPKTSQCELFSLPSSPDSLAPSCWVDWG